MATRVGISTDCIGVIFVGKHRCCSIFGSEHDSWRGLDHSEEETEHVVYVDMQIGGTGEVEVEAEGDCARKRYNQLRKCFTC